MFRKKNRGKKRTRAMLSAYSIIMILIILLGILSHVLPKAKFAPIWDDEYSDVEVGPGEWEGEESEEFDEGSEELELPEDESFEPAVGDEVTGENLPESRMLTDEPVSEDEISNRSTDGVLMIDDESMEGDEADDTTLIASETETYDTLEECEDEYGEESCAIVDGSGVVGAKLYQAASEDTKKDDEKKSDDKSSDEPVEGEVVDK